MKGFKGSLRSVTVEMSADKPFLLLLHRHGRVYLNRELDEDAAGEGTVPYHDLSQTNLCGLSCHKRDNSSMHMTTQASTDMATLETCPNRVSKPLQNCSYGTYNRLLNLVRTSQRAMRRRVATLQI